MKAESGHGHTEAEVSVMPVLSESNQASATGDGRNESLQKPLEEMQCCVDTPTLAPSTHSGHLTSTLLKLHCFKPLHSELFVTSARGNKYNKPSD